MNTIGHRIVVLGVTGSGKSTLSRALAEILDLDYIELDNLFWKPHWEMSNDEEFATKVKDSISKSDRWVVDGNYLRAGAPHIWQYVDTFIWLDYPLRINLWRIWKRTWGRFLRREALWESQNKENLWKHFLTRDSLFVYAIQSHAVKRERYTQLLSDTTFEHYHKLHFQSPKQTDDWLDELRNETR